MVKTALSWHNVVHNKLRALAAIGGIAFAILLMFMQLGIFAAAETSALLLYDELDFDLLLTSPQYLFFSRTGTFHRAQLRRATDVPGVQSAAPLLSGYHLYRNPSDRLRRGMLIVGIDPDRNPFRIVEVQQESRKLYELDSLLVDRRSRGDYGTRKVGDRADFGGPELNIVGEFSIGPGFIAGADALVSEATFRKLFHVRNPDQVNLGLVKLETGADVEAVRSELRRRFGPDVKVWTRPEIERAERHYFVNVKPIGIMFRSGVLVAFLVGGVTLYQILSTEVTNRLRELATLKAMGYSDGYVYKVIMQEGFLFAGLGYVPAFVLALGVYFLIRTGASVPVAMTLERAVTVFVLTCVMCAISSVFALRKVRIADPADLF